MKKITLLIILLLIFSGCAGEGSRGFFGRGVNIAMDPRTLGTQIDDSIMQQNLLARLVLTDKKHFLKIGAKVLDGRIFLTGKVDHPEEKLQITKIAWETKGARSVKSAITIKGETNFKNSAKDALITTQLRTALIFDRNIKGRNYNLDTINGKIYIFGIALTKDEKRKVIEEGKGIYGVKEVIPSIILVEDLSRNKS